MTRLMVLGLLRLQPMSGYEIQQLLQVSQSDQWAGILPGSIYHALKKLDQEGFIQIHSIETIGNRSKAIYEITEQGVEEYKQLLIQSFTIPSVVLPTDLYTGLSMLSLPNPAVESEAIIAAVQEQLNMLRQQWDRIKIGLEKKKQQSETRNVFQDFTFNQVEKHYRLQTESLEELLKILQEDIAEHANPFTSKN